MEKAIIISRCSTNETKQDVSTGVNVLTKKYGNQYDIVKSFAYYQSGTKNGDKNKEILDYVKANGIQHIVTLEVSRISRRVSQSMMFIEEANEAKINIIIDNYNLHTLTPEKQVNDMSMMVLSLASSMASAELSMTKKRLDRGRAIFIEKNGTGALGRKTSETKDKFLSKHDDIIKLLNKNISIRNVSTLTSKSIPTVQKVKNTLKEAA